MSQPRRKISASKIELSARKPNKIKQVLKDWVAASEAKDCDALGLDGAPEWVENAWAEVVKVVMPGNRLPVKGEWDVELIGELLGRLHVFSKLFSGEVAMGTETQKEYERLQQQAGAHLLPPEKQKALEADLAVKMIATEQSIPQMLAAAMDSSHADALKFQRGLSRGMTLQPDELTTARTFRRHTRTYYVLALFWPFWITCKSLREVYDHLCKAVGEKKIGSFRTFEKICEKIGFKLRGRGRPSEIK